MDKLAIYNMAISLTRSRVTLASVSSTGAEAELCEKWYQPARDFCFELAFWPRIKKTEILALLKENDFADDWEDGDPPLPWRFAYAAPSDLITPRLVWQSEDILDTTNTIKQTLDDPPNWNFESGNYISATGTATYAIFTNAEQAVLEFTATNDTPSTWPSSLALAVAHKMAEFMSMGAGGKIDHVSYLSKRANEYAAAALQNQANQHQYTLPDNDGAILDSRNGLEVSDYLVRDRDY